MPTICDQLRVLATMTNCNLYIAIILLVDYQGLAMCGTSYHLRVQGVRTQPLDHRQRGKATHKPSSFSSEMIQQPAQMVGFGWFWSTRSRIFLALNCVWYTIFYHIIRISRAKVTPKNERLKKT
jgi:hypothetical protein